ncbi:MAG: hypothetical protein QW717_00505 [Candidatus Bathyarchaeia archaeon]
MSDDMDKIIREIILGTLEKFGIKISRSDIDYRYTIGEDAQGVFIDAYVTVNLHNVNHNCGIWRIRNGQVTNFAPSENEIQELESYERYNVQEKMRQVIQQIIMVDSKLFGSYKTILTILKPFVERISSLERLLEGDNPLAIAIISIIESSDWSRRLGKVSFDLGAFSNFNERIECLRMKLGGRWFRKETEILSKLCRSASAVEGRKIVEVKDVLVAFDFYEAIMYELYDFDRLLQPGRKSLVSFKDLKKPADLPNIDSVRKIFSHWSYLTLKEDEFSAEQLVDSILRFAIILYAYSQYLYFRRIATDNELRKHIEEAFKVNIRM